MRSINFFFLKPLLFVSLGLAVATIVFANARNPFDPPGRPGTPQILDFWNDGCDLIFQRPTSDGGAPITKYIIDSRTVMSPNWIPSAIFDPQPTKYIIGSVRNLSAGHEVVFRAAAVNMAGLSEPSEQSTSIILKDR